MRVISKRPLREFWLLHPEARSELEEWYRKARGLSAGNFAELKQTFGSTDYAEGVTIFDAGGHHHRLATVIHYDKQRIYVRQVMTHAE
jgi:mRNA interferase HigB